MMQNDKSQVHISEGGNEIQIVLKVKNPKFVKTVRPKSENKLVRKNSEIINNAIHQASNHFIVP